MSTRGLVSMYRNVLMHRPQRINSNLLFPHGKLRQQIHPQQHKQLYMICCRLLSSSHLTQKIPTWIDAVKENPQLQSQQQRYFSTSNVTTDTAAATTARTSSSSSSSSSSLHGSTTLQFHNVLIVIKQTAYEEYSQVK